jgi:pantoate--beta-alanine ligase
VQIVRNGEELAFALADVRRSGTVALVPTMGALHAGHLALVAEAKAQADAVLATIFVNPLQFNDPADLGRYPRTEAEDLSKLQAAGCDIVWLPTPEQLYPPGFATTVSVSGLSERWEGEHRPGHFDGVATVVAKLLVSIRPTVAVFGEKDWQQLAVIRRLTEDLSLGIEIIGVPTVREEDGLALSSRNTHLTTDQRARAAALPRALETAREAIISGAPVAKVLSEARNSIIEAGFSRVDYLDLVDASTLEPLPEPQGGMRLIAAAVIGGTRLIDNLPVRDMVWTC